MDNNVQTYSSYSGADIKIYAALNQAYTREIADRQKKIANQIAKEELAYDSAMVDLESQSDVPSVEPTPVDSSDFTNISDTMNNGVVFKEVGELQTISFSGYREKEAVVGLGGSAPRGFTRGIHTIAGTAIFTVIHQKALNELFNIVFIDDAFGQMDTNLMRIDQLPPLDIFVTFDNEFGDRSRLSIYGVEFMNEGLVMSINDLMTESSVNYLARHVSPLRSVDRRAPDLVDGAMSSMISPDSNLYNGINDEYDRAKAIIKATRERFL